MWFTLARSKRYSPGPARLAPGVRAVCSDMVSSINWLIACRVGKGGPDLDVGHASRSAVPTLHTLVGHTLRDVHDHPRQQIEPRLDRINVDIFGVVRVRPEAAQAEA